MTQPAQTYDSSDAEITDFIVDDTTDRHLQPAVGIATAQVHDLHSNACVLAL